MLDLAHFSPRFAARGVKPLPHALRRITSRSPTTSSSSYTASSPPGRNTLKLKRLNIPKYRRQTRATVPAIPTQTRLTATRVPFQFQKWIPLSDLPSVTFHMAMIKPPKFTPIIGNASVADLVRPKYAGVLGNTWIRTEKVVSDIKSLRDKSKLVEKQNDLLNLHLAQIRRFFQDKDRLIPFLKHLGFNVLENNNDATN